MKRFFRSRFLGALLLGALLGTSTACLGPYDSAGVSVSIGPPALRVEARSASPGRGYVWVDGYWDWGNGDWYWVPGQWVVRERGHARWERPRYYQRHGRWYYNRGRWH